MRWWCVCACACVWLCARTGLLLEETSLKGSKAKEGRPKGPAFATPRSGVVKPPGNSRGNSKGNFTQLFKKPHTAIIIGPQLDVQLGCILLGFWLSKEPAQYFTRPPK